MASKLKSKNKKAIFTFMGLEITVLGLIAVVISVMLVVQGISFLQAQAAADVKVSLNAGSAILTSSKTVVVTLDTRGKKITYANIAVRFDPKIMSLSSNGIVPSGKLANTIGITSPNDASSGMLTMTFSARPEDMQALSPSVYELARFVVNKNSEVISSMQSLMTVDIAASQIVDINARAMTMDTQDITFSVNPLSTNVPVSTPRQTASTTTRPSPTPVTTYNIRLQNIPDPNSAADLFEIDAFIIGGRRYEEMDPMFKYSEKWVSTGRTKYTTHTDSVSFVTTNPDVTLLTSRAFNRANRVEIYVNNILKQTIRLTNSTTEQYQVQLNLR